MSWLSRVIALVVTRITKPTEETLASQTQTAGLVSPEPTMQHGNKDSVLTTKRQRAPRKHKPEPALAQLGTTARSLKQTPKSAQAERGQDGSQPQSTAPRTVRQSRTRDNPVALLTTQDSSLKPVQKLAQTTSGKRGSRLKTTASQSSELKARRSVAQSTKAEQSLSKERSQPVSPDHGKQSATRVSKTHQPALLVQTTKQKAADSTTRVQKPTQNKTLAQTRTARQSKVRGS